MTGKTKAANAGLVLGVGIVLWVQVASMRAQEVSDPTFHTNIAMRGEGVSAQPLPYQELGTAGPVLVQPVVEPTVGGSMVEAPLFPADTATVVESHDGKSLTTVGDQRRWHMILGISASAVYDDNIFLDDRVKESDFIFG